MRRLRVEPQDAGFTLVEMLVAMVVVFVLLGFTFTAIVASNGVVKTTAQLQNLNEEARQAINRMARDLRQATGRDDCDQSHRNHDEDEQDHDQPEGDPSDGAHDQRDRTMPRSALVAASRMAFPKTTSESPTPRWLTRTRPDGRDVPAISASPMVACGSG